MNLFNPQTVNFSLITRAPMTLLTNGHEPKREPKSYVTISSVVGLFYNIYSYIKLKGPNKNLEP